MFSGQLEPISKARLYLVLPVPSFSADQSSAPSLSHGFFSPKRSLKSLAFLLLWLSGLRLESGMNPQGTVWKSLSRQLVSAVQCGHLGVPGFELWRANPGRDGLYVTGFTME